MIKEPPLNEPDWMPHTVRRKIKEQKARALAEAQQHEEALFHQMRQDEENEWAIAQMCDEGTYFEPQEYK